MRAKSAKRLHRTPKGGTTPPRDMGVFHRLVPTYLWLHLLQVSWSRIEEGQFAVLWAATCQTSGFGHTDST
jgi:hypothetical protein